MGMVVRSNVMAVNANRQLGVNNTQVGKNLEKLSSGFRINRAGDDASGLAISEKMKAQIKGLETASMNAQDGISMIQTAEGALTEVHDMLNRMVEIATKSSNGILANNGDEQKSLQEELGALRDEIDRIGQSTNFNGITLLSTSAIVTLQVGDTADAFNRMTISLTSMMSGALGISGVTISTTGGASAAIATIKSAITSVSTQRGKFGALQNRLEHTINNLDVSAENISAANSRIRDTDMAKQMMEYTKMNVLTQSAQAMLAQANQQPQSILQLLQ